MTVEIADPDKVIKMFADQPKNSGSTQTILGLIEKAIIHDDTIIDLSPDGSKAGEPLRTVGAPKNISEIITGVDTIQLMTPPEKDNRDVIILRPTEKELDGLSEKAKAFLQLSVQNYRRPLLGIQRVTTGVASLYIRRRGRKLGFQIDKVEKVIETSASVLDTDSWVVTDILLDNNGLDDLAELIEIGKKLSVTKSPTF